MHHGASTNGRIMSGVIPEPDTTIIDYEIAGASEHSGEYVAEHILIDRPRDHSSRWSAACATPNAKQWIRLCMKQLCVLKSITFGKFYKVHPCNMKEFRVLVGTNKDNMTEVLRAALKNDSIPETFSIRYTNHVGMAFPTKYVEIVPISVHGQNFNTSIWHISLSGIVDEAYVEEIRSRHEEHRENVALRQVLKHLRQRRLLTPMNQILAQSGLQLEHPLITSIHQSFVLQGNWQRTEQLIRDCADAGLLQSYRQTCQARTRWTRIHAFDADGDIPCRRGGHAMCMDEDNGIVYLFGGWDGQRDLDDFWAYDIAQDAWRLLSLAASREKNGPTPRACHKMVFDKKTGSIYLLGRLGAADKIETQGTHMSGTSSDRRGTPILRDGAIEWRGEMNIYIGPDGNIADPTSSAARRVVPLIRSSSMRIPSPQCSEFYRYHTRGLDAGQWDLLAFDTAATGGPPLISDHQMEIDSEAQVIYVFGGRVVDAELEALKFSGMYSYDIRTSKWKMYNTSDAYASHPSIPPRFGHSMVLDPKSQTLFIFGGQRDEKYLSDMYTFHIPTNTVTELYVNFTPAGGPEPCFTQRAVIDSESREIYIFGGLTRTKSGAFSMLEADSPYWIYRYDRPEIPGRWSKILPDDGVDTDAAWPQPRYAHQIVYDSRTKTVYMHGGNAGLEGDEPVDGEDLPGPRRRMSGPGMSDDTMVAITIVRGGAPAPSSSPVPGPEVDADSDMKRLDDFWKLEVIRPSFAEITRRAVFEVRKQQFREMCEDGPPIKALTFLQTRVSEVVNHEDPQEAKDFRSLLSAHLLSAFPRAMPKTAPVTEVETVIEVSTDTDRDDTPLPRKRSRPGSPEQGLKPIIRWEEDPVEEGDGTAPSPDRYRQRTEMFERLMAFINDGEKEPDQNLVDMLSEDTHAI
ncbi:Muskelin N-terminus-domain-containing protein [Trametes gibbosa]|nr:Muskelin N-terminus-domain-containing protein [Trametes gibbosa]